ncbi:retrovirus-related pol polyprotein from transposon TNT 1-94 [Tanacetum coccineum]
MPPRKSISTIPVKKTQPSSNKFRKVKNIKLVGSSSQSKTVGSKISNHSKPMKKWGSKVSTAPSSSRVNFRFGNDQIANIMGYGDYQLGNVTFSRVYYVEGLGNNLFSVDGDDLLSGLRDTNLYIISLDDMLKSSPIWKSKKSSHKPKADDTNQEKLYLLHMDLCGPIRVESINGKKYILVIIDDYLRFTWVKFLRSKDEAPKVIIKCLKKIQVDMNATVRNVRTDNRTEFVNQTLREYYENIHHTSSLQQTPYELMHDKKPDLSYLYVFGSLCYPTNGSEDLGKFKAKADIGIFVGYASSKKAFRIYNKRLVPNPIPQPPYVPPTNNDWDILFQPMFDKFFNPPPSVGSTVPVAAAQRPAAPTGSPVSTSLEQDAPSASTSSTQ